MNVLLIVCPGGSMYRYFQVPLEKLPLTENQLDEINGYYIGPEEDDPKYRMIEILFDLVENGDLNTYKSPSPINADKIVLIGSY